MANESPKVLEYRHIKCGESMVNAILKEHGMFYWELVQTQTVVSKESHLEPGGFLEDNVIYSVWTEERFVTIDLKRDKNIPNIDKIKSVESDYFQIVARLQEIGCSPLDNYETLPKKKYRVLGFIPSWLFFGGILHPFIHKRKERERERRQNLHKELISQLQELLENNKQILNV